MELEKREGVEIPYQEGTKELVLDHGNWSYTEKNMWIDRQMQRQLMESMHKQVLLLKSIFL